MDASGLVFAITLDGAGGGRDVGWDGIQTWKPGDGPLWIHLDYEGDTAQRWLHDSGIDAIIQQALLSEDPRPRSLQHGDGLLLIVRVINDNAGADPEDMVSLRMWIETDRIVSLRHRSTRVAARLHDDLLAGRGPRRAGEIVTRIYDQLLVKIGKLVDSIDEGVDDLEDEVLRGGRPELRHELAERRRQAIGLRRFIVPQRAAIAALPAERVSWFADVDRLQLRELAEHLQRMIEELDAARDRASVTQEELSSRQAEMVDRRLYVLSLIAAVFLPLGLITGILGVNVGGIPGRQAEYGFIIVVLGIVAIGFLQLWLFRRLRWL
jgi:zinc transporter